MASYAPVPANEVGDLPAGAASSGFPTALAEHHRMSDATFSSSQGLAPNAAPPASSGLGKEWYGSAGAEYHPVGSPGDARREGAGFWAGKKKWVAAALAAIAIIVVAVVVPVYYKVIKPSSSSSNRSSSNDGSSTSPDSPSSTASPDSPDAPTFGSDGSHIIDSATNKEFVYQNKFGGHWSSVPFDDSAQAQSYTPPLNESFRYGTDRMLGVNLGGWLVLEPFIVPAMYEPCENYATPCVDEWTLQTYLADQNRRETAMDEHYSTFITEQDFARIAGAGLNWIRLPVPFWMVEKEEGEPYVAGQPVFKYFLKAIEWARKYGLRIKVDLHTVPGSQNGWNHSGRLGGINFLNGTMGIANAQRTLNTIRTIAQFISQPQYKNVVPQFGIVNEIRSPLVGIDRVKSFYVEAYNMLREELGTGEGNGPYITIHDGFSGGSDTWNDFMPGADRLILDHHPYFAFDGAQQDPLPEQAMKPCARWGASVNQTRNTFGLYIAGEWSLAINDCGTVNGVGLGTRQEGTFPGSPEGYGPGACAQWDDWQSWDDSTRAGMKQLALNSFDALQDAFFWTWKIGNTTTGARINPFWDYSLGLEQGWIPSDPYNEPRGACAAFATAQGTSYPYSPATTLSAWQTGGAGAGEVSANTAQYPWPLTDMNNIAEAQMTLVPTLTQTGARVTLSAPAVTWRHGEATETPDVGDGWASGGENRNDAWVKVQGCSYPDAWEAFNAAPTGGCGTAAGRKRNALSSPPAPTPAPR